MNLKKANLLGLYTSTLLIGLSLWATEPKIDATNEAALRKATATVPMAQPLVDCGNTYLNCKSACQDAECLSVCAEQNAVCSAPYNFEF